MVNKKEDSQTPVSQLLYCISNSMRRSIIDLLGDRQDVTFSDLMELCGLSPRYDTTGNFVYHLSQLCRMGVVRKGDDAYRLTPHGQRVHRIVGLVERETRILDQEAETQRDETALKKTNGEGVSVSVRPALYGDRSVVAELVASEYCQQASQRYQVPEEYREQRRRETDFTLGVTGRNLVFLAEEGGEQVGVCWWTLIEREAIDGGVNKEAFLEHLFIKPEHDCERVAGSLMEASIPILLDEEKATILNVWHGENEPLDREFYARYGITQPQDLELLMHVADWARPRWREKTEQSD